MTEMVTISKDKLKRLEDRVKKMAISKSYIQVNFRLMSRMNDAAPGLEKTIENLLRNIMDIIGGANLILYYTIDKSIFYSDVYGKKATLDEIDDPFVRKVFDNYEPIAYEHEFSDTKMITRMFSKAYTWFIPLLVGEELIGVLKMESLNIAVQELYRELPPFFNYAALILKNEILGHTRLKKMNDRLSQKNMELSNEIKERKRVEQKLWDVNEKLEERVMERTVELRNANEKLSQELIERRRAESEIRHLKNYLANIIDSMPSVLVGMNRDEIVTQWNREAETATGISAEEAIGKPVSEVLSDFSFWIKAMCSKAEEQSPAVMENLLLEKEGERHFHNLMLYPLVSNGMEGAVIRIEDVTERSKIQEMMIQTEKMMSLGGLAAGMAHEINNPLGIIAQAAKNIERRVAPDFPANQKTAAELGFDLGGLHTYFEKRQINRFIDSIDESVKRAAKIVSNMLQFSRHSEATYQPASLESIMEQAVELAANDYDLKKKYDFRSIEIIREYASNIPKIPIIIIEIEQVLLNLLKNSAQAMATAPQKRTPQIILRIRLECRYAVMEVEDNGPGMEEKVRTRVFEPFFTTKASGIGTGLGLSVSYMIITQNHRGLMEVESRAGNGTCFTVRLPIQIE